MKVRESKLKAIEAALPAVPIVLCNLIFEYENIELHTWRSDDPIIVSVVSSLKPKSPLIIEMGLNMQRVVHLDRGHQDDPWYTFTSAMSLRGGSRRWLVGCTQNEEDKDGDRGWCAAGVTTNSSSYVMEDPNYDSISTSDSWVTRLSWGRESPIKVSHGGGSKLADRSHDSLKFDAKIGEEALVISGCARDCWIQFLADRESLRILALFLEDGDNLPLVVMTAKSVEEFDSLRPCVVLAGRVAATILSENI